ncbi:MAG: tRNA-dihydrouridine synthase [Coriobacteriales bacterium]|jgi:nifR3 family TIM-barrel protein|nr:tRNA-dihydrouridine synthase [Coriobacteriales bacterium]
MRRLLLAPMAGVNDPVFRAICRRLGAELTCTEMVSARALASDHIRSWELLETLPRDRPFAIQLFGAEPKIMALQARRLEHRFGDDLAHIDINMGCPARKILASGSGAALMANPSLAQQVIEAVVASVNLPVTVKFRKGFAASDNTALEFALMAQASGVAAVAVHGRTAAQLYRGEADKELPGRLAQALDIPVIANGDVHTPANALAYLHSGAAAVMFATGARGNPWIFKQTQALLRDPTMHVSEVSFEERVALSEEHIRGLYLLQPQRLVTMRRHLAWYFKGTSVAAAARRFVCACTHLDDYLSLLETLRGMQRELVGETCRDLPRAGDRLYHQPYKSAIKYVNF